MNNIGIYACEMCGVERGKCNRWFVLSEDCWQHTLKILRWEPHLAPDTGTNRLCCAAHLQQLVCQWMLTGSLAYVPAALRSHGRHAHNSGASLDLDTAASRLGEVMLDRNTMAAMNAQPEMVLAIMDALDAVLEDSEDDEPEAEPMICDA